MRTVSSLSLSWLLVWCQSAGDVDLQQTFTSSHFQDLWWVCSIRWSRRELVSPIPRLRQLVGDGVWRIKTCAIVDNIIRKTNDCTFFLSKGVKLGSIKYFNNCYYTNRVYFNMKDGKNTTVRFVRNETDWLTERLCAAATSLRNTVVNK
jgi:hypothetical protein